MKTRLMSSLGWSALLLPLALSLGCAVQASESAPGSNDEANAKSANPGPASEYVSGELVYEIVQSPTASVRFMRQSDQSILTEFTGNMDADPGPFELFQRASKERDAASVFKVLKPGVPVPVVLANAARLHSDYVAAHPELDPANAKELRIVGEHALPAGGGAISPELARRALTPLPSSTDGVGVSQQAVEEPPWDWNADAAWWTSNFCSKNSSWNYERECTTNITWRTSGDLASYELWVYGLAASHVATAHFKGLQYSCWQCWLVATCCGYDTKWDITVQPRTWKGYHMEGASGGGYKSVNLWGNDPLPHIDMAWQGRQ